MILSKCENTITNSFHLVQRCLERDKATAERRLGVDRILEYDYMGSSEFEWGTLPTTFKIMRELALTGKLNLWKTTTLVTYQNKPFWVLTPDTWLPTEFEDTLRNMIDGKIHMQESHYMNYWLPLVKTYALSSRTDDKFRKEMRERATAWIAVVEKRHSDSNIQPALWCVLEGTARKLFEELKTPRTC